jgi:hypothetical protein
VFIDFKKKKKNQQLTWTYDEVNIPAQQPRFHIATNLVTYDTFVSELFHKHIRCIRTGLFLEGHTHTYVKYANYKVSNQIASQEVETLFRSK